MGFGQPGVSALSCTGARGLVLRVSWFRVPGGHALRSLGLVFRVSWFRVQGHSFAIALVPQALLSIWLRCFPRKDRKFARVFRVFMIRVWFLGFPTTDFCTTLFSRETAKHGLHFPAGNVSCVGISGFILGGGMGAGCTAFGAGCDNVISMEVGFPKTLKWKPQRDPSS